MKYESCINTFSNYIQHWGILLGLVTAAMLASLANVANDTYQVYNFWKLDRWKMKDKREKGMLVLPEAPLAGMYMLN